MFSKVEKLRLQWVAFETPLCWVTASKMSILAKENNDMHWKSGFEVFNAFGSIREKCYWSDIWIIMMIYLKLGLESKSIQNEDDVIDMTSEGTWVPCCLPTRAWVEWLGWLERQFLYLTEMQVRWRLCPCTSG